MPFVNTPTGARTKVGVGIQPQQVGEWNVFNGGCKATDLMDYDSGSIEVQRPALFSSALRDTPSERHGSVTGDFSGQGEYNVDVLPSGAFTKLLTGVFGPPVSTQIGVTPVWKHIWKNTWEYRLLTIAHKIGDTVNMYTDCLASSFKVSASKGQDGPVQASFGLMAGNRIIQSTEAAVGLDTSGYPNASLFSSAKVKILIDNSLVIRYNSFDASYDRGAQPKGCFGQGLGPSGWILGGSSTGLSLGSYFDSEEELKRFMGQLTGVAKPYGFSETIREFAVKILIEQVVGANTYSLEFLYPKCALASASEPVQGRDVIMQPLSIEPRYDTVAGTDVVVTLMSPDIGTEVIRTGVAVAATANSVFIP